MGEIKISSQKRVLQIFSKLLDGDILYKQDLIEEYGKQSSTIQRDISVINEVISEDLENKYLDGLISSIEYEAYMDTQLREEGRGQYSLQQLATKFKTHSLTDIELFVLIKILIASRSLCKDEMTVLLNKLIVMSNNQEDLEEFLRNEVTYYAGVPNEDILPKIEMIQEMIEKNSVVEFEYTKNNVTEKLRRVPTAVYFSDLYFYMLTSNQTDIDNDDLRQLNKFRINNIKKMKVISETNKKEYTKRFEGGILRKQTVYAFLGDPITLVIDFYYEPIYVLDRFPDSKIISQKDGVTRIEMQVNNGYGMKMWLLQQENQLKVISPKYMRDYIVDNMKDSLSYYGLEVNEGNEKD